MRTHQLYLKKKKSCYFSPCLLLCEKMGKKHLELPVNSKVQPENSSVAHYTHYLSSFAALFQLNHILFPSGLLLLCFISC